MGRGGGGLSSHPLGLAGVPLLYPFFYKWTNTGRLQAKYVPITATWEVHLLPTFINFVKEIVRGKWALGLTAFVSILTFL